MSKCAKSVICLLILTLVMGITGCNNGSAGNNLSEVNNNISTGSNVSEMNNNINSKGEVKISELFLTDELRLWYLIESDESGTISYKHSLSDVFICYKERVTRYRTNLEFEDIDGMSDEEIVSYVKTNCVEGPFDENITFIYTRDDSGNNIKTEILQFSSFAETGKNGLYYKKDLSDPGYTIKVALEPQTVLSNQYFGILESGGGHYPDALITKYDFENDTKIVLNDVNDDFMVEKD